MWVCMCMCALVFGCVTEEVEREEQETSGESEKMEKESSEIE